MNKNIRESNFELLRIICMLMIVTLHTLGHGGAIKNINIYHINFFIANILESVSIVAVNCYVLISGYFGIHSKFRFRKILELYIQILFYSITLTFLFWITKIQNVSEESVINMIFPISRQVWWFMSVFFVLYMLTPYINKLLKSISFRQFNKLIFILVSIFVLWTSVPKFKPISIQNGYSLYNFILLYIIGAYINMFYKHKVLNKCILFTIYIGISILLSVINISISKLIGHNWGKYSYNFILIFIESIALFLIFKDIKIKNRLVNKLSSLTLGVYLIHDHIYVRNFIYKTLGYQNCYYTKNFIFYTVTVIFIIYTLTSFIEYVRQYLFNYIAKYTENAFYNIEITFNKISLFLEKKLILFIKG